MKVWTWPSTQQLTSEMNFSLLRGPSTFRGPCLGAQILYPEWLPNSTKPEGMTNVFWGWVYCFV